LGLCSAFWSSDPGYTLLQWFMVAEGLVFAWAFYEVYLYSIDKYPGNPTLAGMFTRSLLPTMIVFLVGVVVDPDLFYRQTHGGEVSRLGGYIINPNELGMLAGVAIAAVCTEILDRRDIVLNVITGLVCAVALYMTESRSSMMALVLVGGLAGWLAGRWKLRLQMFGGLFLALPLVWAYLNKKGDSDEILNATGRIPFWTDLIMDAFPKEPILGYGFMRINYEEKYDSLHSYAAGMCHNAFIQVIINLGLLGATIIFFQMVTTFVGIAKSPIPFVRRYSWLMLAPLIINSMTEFGIFGENNYGILFYQLILLQLCIEYAERK
jgi:O-antigen ligase